MHGVMRLQFEDPKMQEYFEALPSKVRAFLRNSKIEISSPGELMMIGEHDVMYRGWITPKNITS